jgi:hypothetical protein
MADDEEFGQIKPVKSKVRRYRQNKKDPTGSIGLGLFFRAIYSPLKFA